MSVVEDWRASLELQDALRLGQWPEPLPDVRLQTGEPVFAVGGARLDQQHGLQLAFGNAQPSTHAAAQHWIQLASGAAHLTPLRVMVQSSQEMSLGWTDLTGLYADHEGVYFAYAASGAQPLTFRLHVEFPMWWISMIRAVVWKQTTESAPPDWVRRQLSR